MSGLSPYGLFELPFWGYVVVTFVTIQVMFLGVTLYLHRDQAHGGLTLHPILRHVFRFWLWFSSGVVTREWVAVHRRHHVYADQEGDPHSPVIFGLKRVVLEGYELYLAATQDPVILKNYGKGTPDDWIERHLYSRYSNLGIVLFSLVSGPFWYPRDCDGGGAPDCPASLCGRRDQWPGARRRLSELRDALDRHQPRAMGRPVGR